jgi:Lon protease-like protein
VNEVPIFPLPETVFFPSVRLPLHLFEPRYRQMGEDIVSGNGLLVVVLLQPGWQRDYYGNPPVHEIATLGRVETHEKLADGRMNLVLQGLSRVRLLAPEGSEQLEGKLYRARPVLAAPERKPAASAATSEMQLRLLTLFHELAEKSGAAAELSSLSPVEPFDVVVNRIASVVDLPPATKQRLLEEDDLLARAAILETHVTQALAFWRTLSRFRALAPEDPRTN